MDYIIKMLLDEKILATILVLGFISICFAATGKIMSGSISILWRRIFGILGAVFIIIPVIVVCFNGCECGETISEDLKLEIDKVEVIGDGISVTVGIPDNFKISSNEIYRYFIKSNDDKYYFSNDSIVSKNNLEYTFVLPNNEKDIKFMFCIISLDETLNNKIDDLLSDENYNNDYLKIDEFPTKSKLILEKNFLVKKIDLNKFFFE